MDITLHGAVEQFIQRMVQQGSFPNAEAAVSSLLMQSAEAFTNEALTLMRLPDPPVAFEEQFEVPDFPYCGDSSIVKPSITTMPRLPDPVFD